MSIAFPTERISPDATPESTYRNAGLRATNAVMKKVRDYALGIIKEVEKAVKEAEKEAERGDI